MTPARLVRIGEAARLLGVTTQTLRTWDKTGELPPSRRTSGGTRYYDVAMLLDMRDDASPTIGYVSADADAPQDDLKRQLAAIDAYCDGKGWHAEVVHDADGGRSGLRRVLESAMRGCLRRLILLRLPPRPLAGLLLGVSALQGIELVLLNQTESATAGTGDGATLADLVAAFAERIHGKGATASKAAAAFAQGDARTTAGLLLGLD